MPLTPRFTDAFALAADLHRQQHRKGTAIPYLTHLMSVSALVLEHGGGEEEAIAALLHDALEDQGASYPGGGEALMQAIETRFGVQVAMIVRACSDSDGDPKPPWRDRKEAYIAHLAKAPVPVLRVSAADKLHNARSILGDYRAQGETLWDRFNAGRAQVLWYYESLIRAFRAARAPATLVDELDRTVAEILRLVEEER